MGYGILHHFPAPRSGSGARPGNGRGGLPRRAGGKDDIFQYLLHTCNDGRRKSLFALAANLLPLEDLRRVRSDLTALDAPLSLRAREAARLLDEAARARGIALRLRKKPPRR